MNSAVFSPDGKLVVTGSDDPTARTWDVATGRTLHPLRGHIDNAVSASFSRDSNLIVTGSYDGTART